MTANHSVASSSLSKRTIFAPQPIGVLPAQLPTNQVLNVELDEDEYTPEGDNTEELSWELLDAAVICQVYLYNAVLIIEEEEGGRLPGINSHDEEDGDWVYDKSMLKRTTWPSSPTIWKTLTSYKHRYQT